MATAKKTPKKPVVITTAPKNNVVKKKPAAKKVLVQENTVANVPADKKFAMPVEVKEWIDQATSRIRHLTNENQRLKDELASLRRANRNMERRVMGSE
jgi:hypothetical protein